MSRSSLFALAVATVLVAGGASAQPAGRPARVGYIVVASAVEQAHLTRAFEDGMRELGYVEGRNVVYERRFADGDAGRLPALAAELAQLDLDVIVTGANPVISAVRAATTRTPIVMGVSRDAVGAGFIASHARPGGNVTGLASDPTPDVLGKDLEIFHEILPQARRVALLWNPLPAAAVTYRKAAEDAGRRLGIALEVVEVRRRDELDAAYAAIAKSRVDGVWVLPDPLVFTARGHVVALAAKHRLPAVYWQREFVDAGGLVSYGSNVAAAFRRAAYYVDRILKGTAPGTLAVEQAAKFELVVNLGTARSLGLAIPQSLLLRADDVIQ